jgi:hypothetical protein
VVELITSLDKMALVLNVKELLNSLLVSLRVHCLLFTLLLTQYTSIGLEANGCISREFTDYEHVT